MSDNVRESKIDCKFITPAGDVEAMLHLIEIRYNERIVFWNGVAHITTAVDASKLFESVPSGKPVAFEVRLADGRSGTMFPTYPGMFSDGYFEVGCVGNPNS